MKHFKRISSGVTASIVSLSSLMTIGFTGVAHAAASTCTWTGATNNNFNTAANWSSCNNGSVPGAGDTVVFPMLSVGTATLTNNLIGNPALGGITVGASTSQSSFTDYTIDTLHLADGATITTNGNNGSSISISNAITADGGLIFNGTPNIGASGKNVTVNFGNVTYMNAGPACSGSASDYYLTWAPTGVATVGAASYYQLNGTESSAVVQTGGLLGLPYSTGSVTYSGNITFQGGAATASTCGQQPNYAVETNATNTTLTGTITLNGNVKYEIYDGSTLTITGAINGSGFGLSNSADPYSTGTFVNSSSSNTSTTAAGTQTVPETVLPAVTDSQPTTDLEILPKTVVSLDGSRQSVNVDSGGTLKGTGTAKYLYVGDGGIVAPGHSPGKLTVLNTMNLFGTYQAELKDAQAGDYDQIQVGQATDTDNTNPDVRLGDGNAALPTLAVSLYDGYSIKAGDTFTIINNQSKTDVEGTFSGLPEGATFKVGTAVFSITYKGGDGNDVVLTAITAPTTPDTGFAMISAHPGVTLGLTVAAACAILLIARRTSPTPVRVRAHARRSTRR